MDPDHLLTHNWKRSLHCLFSEKKKLSFQLLCILYAFAVMHKHQLYSFQSNEIKDPSFNLF